MHNITSASTCSNNRPDFTSTIACKQSDDRNRLIQDEEEVCSLTLEWNDSAGLNKVTRMMERATAEIIIIIDR